MYTIAKVSNSAREMPGIELCYPPTAGCWVMLHKTFSDHDGEKRAFMLLEDCGLSFCSRSWNEDPGINIFSIFDVRMTCIVDQIVFRPYWLKSQRTFIYVGIQPYMFRESEICVRPEVYSGKICVKS